MLDNHRRGRRRSRRRRCRPIAAGRWDMHQPRRQCPTIRRGQSSRRRRYRDNRVGRRSSCRRSLDRHRRSFLSDCRRSRPRRYRPIVYHRKGRHLRRLLRSSLCHHRTSRRYRCQDSRTGLASRFHWLKDRHLLGNPWLHLRSRRRRRQPIVWIRSGRRRRCRRSHHRRCPHSQDGRLGWRFQIE